MKNRQVVLMRTDSHDVEGGMDEQWIGRASACVLLLLQEIEDFGPQERAQVGPILVKELSEILWKVARAYQWSKWDMRSTWYLADLQPPVNVDPATNMIFANP